MNTQVNFSEVKNTLLNGLFSLTAKDFNLNGVNVDIDNRILDIESHADVTAFDSANNEINLLVSVNYVPFDLESNDGFISFTVLPDDLHQDHPAVTALVDEVNLILNDSMESVELSLIAKAKELAVKNAKMYRVGLVNKMADQGILLA